MNLLQVMRFLLGENSSGMSGLRGGCPLKPKSGPPFAYGRSACLMFYFLVAFMTILPTYARVVTLSSLWLSLLIFTFPQLLR